MELVSYMTPGFPRSLFEAIAAAIGADLRLEQALSGPAPGEDPFASGQADLGWICSTSYVDDPAVAGLRVIDRLGPWPVQPLVMRADLGDAERLAIQHALLGASTQAPLRDELQAAALAGLTLVDDNHYAPVRRAMSRPS